MYLKKTDLLNNEDTLMCLEDSLMCLNVVAKEYGEEVVNKN